jgi:hypothetical protein
VVGRLRLCTFARRSLVASVGGLLWFLNVHTGFVLEERAAEVDKRLTEYPPSCPLRPRPRRLLAAAQRHTSHGAASRPQLRHALDQPQLERLFTGACGGARQSRRRLRLLPRQRFGAEGRASGALRGDAEAAGAGRERRERRVPGRGPAATDSGRQPYNARLGAPGRIWGGSNGEGLRGGFYRGRSKV